MRCCVSLRSTSLSTPPLTTSIFCCVCWLMMPFNMGTFEEILLRKPSIVFASHLSRCHIRFAFEVADPSCSVTPARLSTELLISSSKARQLPMMVFAWLDCWAEAPGVDRTTSASKRTDERLRHSSLIAVNWCGASMNCLRTLLASSSSTMKSPTLNPKLILHVIAPYRIEFLGMVRVGDASDASQQTLVKVRLSAAVLPNQVACLTQSAPLLPSGHTIPATWSILTICSL